MHGLITGFDCICDGFQTTIADGCGELWKPKPKPKPKPKVDDDISVVDGVRSRNVLIQVGPARTADNQLGLYY